MIHSRFELRVSPWAVGLFAFLLFVLMGPLAHAQSGGNQSRTVQYVFVIDDSGSMRVVTRDGPAADPERLAIFATQSLLAMLDDSDEVSIVRLNGPADGEALTPIARLSQNRSQLEKMIRLDGLIAKYPGKQTPCSSALAGVKEQLNRAYRANVSQVVIFLTDGECTGPDVNPTTFLRGLRSHSDGAFQFYLLRWRGRVFSRSLVTLATQTGGTAVEVGADDPTELLSPFASVLSRSQGYEAYLLRPGNNTLPAHSGARRLRLLAVAPDSGQDLKFTIEPAGQGKPPATMGATRTGLHQYERGKRYRYAALDYRPGTTPIRVTVSGAGRDWAVVAVPEYRLFVDLKLTEGRCGEAGQETQFVEVGAGICARVELINEDGDLLTADVAGRGTQSAIEYQAAGESKARKLPASRSGDEPRFMFERVNLERGDHVFKPSITLAGSGQDSGITLTGPARTLQVSSRHITPNPSRFEFGDLVPGTEQYHEVTLVGNFPANRGRMVVESRKDIPECVTFELSGVAEGESQLISPGQAYTLAVRVAPYCGPSAFKRVLDTALRIEFDRGAHSAATPAVVLPMKATLLNQIGIPESISTTLNAGERKDLNIRLGGNQQRDITFQAILPPSKERVGWPSGDLEVVFVDERGDVIREGRDYALSHTITFEPAAQGAQPQAGPPLRMRVLSRSCCEGAVYRTELALVPSMGSREPVRVPVAITVEAGSLMSCWGPTIVRSFLGLLLLLLLAYLFNMYRSTNLIDRDRLADRLVPLRWNEYGEPKPHTRATDEVRRMVRRHMSLRTRIVAWIKANPLVFGLPGRQYYETVELILDRSRDVGRSRLITLGDRDRLDEVQKNPVLGLAKIYCTARGGMTFFTVFAEGNRVGVFHMPDDFGTIDDEEHTLKVTTLRRRTELVTMHSDKEPDTTAGWRVG